MAPLQPAPVMDQVTAWLAPEHTVAVNVCCPFTGTLAVTGTTEMGVAHELVMVTAAVEDFDASATLVATTPTPGGAGTEGGAVYVEVLPFVLSVPQADGQALPVKLQVTAVAGLPVPFTCAVNCWVAPVATEAVAGVSVTWISLSSETVAVPLAELSAWLVAVMATVGLEGRIWGAV